MGEEKRKGEREGVRGKRTKERTKGIIREGEKR